MKRIVLLVLNENNFNFILAYASRGLLKNLAGLIERFGMTEITSEPRCEELEPRISGAGVPAELGAFRLGDTAA